MREASSGQTRSEAQRPRWLERGDVTPLVLPPWAIDSARGNCTTLTLLAPPATQFILRLHPWPGSPGAVASSAGALQLTRCGRERVALLELRLEMRSPRALILPWVSVGSVPPPALTVTLPERDAGPASPSSSPGPAPERDKLAARLQSFETAALSSGATATERARVANTGVTRLTLGPGCHRLLSTAEDPPTPAPLLLAEKDDDVPQRIEPEDSGDARHELCTLRARPLQAVLVATGGELEKTLAVAHFPPPAGLPERFGPDIAERLLRALGGSQAPRKLGPLVFASLGAQGLTRLPQALLPNTCYVATVVTVHGTAQALSLGARSGAQNAEATVRGAEVGTRLGFCTDKYARAELDVEARGVGVAWLVTLFQLGPARAEEP